MGWETLVKAYANETTTFWLQAINRYKVARQKIAGNTYRADDLASDVGNFWMAAGDAILNLLPFGGTPVLPTVAINAQQPIPGQLKGTAFQPMEVPPGATLSSTPLVRIGGSETIAAGQVTATLVDGALDVFINLPTTGNTLGVYHGVVYANATPVALLLVQVS
jgi:hypothetical protein